MKKSYKILLYALPPLVVATLLFPHSTQCNVLSGSYRSCPIISWARWPTTLIAKTRPPTERWQTATQRWAALLVL